MQGKRRESEREADAELKAGGRKISENAARPLELGGETNGNCFLIKGWDGRG